MSDEENTQPTPEPTTPSENPVSEPNPVPVSPQEPIPDAPALPTDSVPAEAPPRPTEITPSPESAVSVKDDISANEPLKPAPAPENTPAPDNPNITIEKHGNDVTITEVMEPTVHSEPAMAQMAGNEPLESDKRRENLGKANQTRQNKKRKKIDSVLTLFSENTKITNDEVEKLLHVSDATATRYLETLEKEGKIKQVGKTGKGVSYTKI